MLVVSPYNCFVSPADDFEPAHSCRLSAPCLPADRPSHREGGPT